MDIIRLRPRESPAVGCPDALVAGSLGRGDSVAPALAVALGVLVGVLAQVAFALVLGVGVVLC